MGNLVAHRKKPTPHDLHMLCAALAAVQVLAFDHLSVLTFSVAGRCLKCPSLAERWQDACLRPRLPHGNASGSGKGPQGKRSLHKRHRAPHLSASRRGWCWSQEDDRRGHALHLRHPSHQPHILQLQTQTRALVPLPAYRSSLIHPATCSAPATEPNCTSLSFPCVPASSRAPTPALPPARRKAAWRCSYWQPGLPIINSDSESRPMPSPTA